MLTNSDLETGLVQASDVQIRAKRLKIVACAVAASMAVASVGYMNPPHYNLLMGQGMGILFMLLCLWLLRYRGLAPASLVLVWGMFVTFSALMWMAEGLRDVSLFTYPIILIVGGLLLRRRHYLALIIAMACFVTLLVLGTEWWGLRTNVRHSDAQADIRNVALMLAGTAYVVWMFVKDIRTAMAGLSHISTHDPLTGLANRAMGQDRVEQAIALAKRRNTGLAVLFVDLDNFKTINDSLGHPSGDAFLKTVAARLTGAVRQSDSVIRQGGDEFVVLLSDITENEGVTRTASAIMEALAQPLVLRGTEINASCSIGIALYPGDATDYENLLRLADMALYEVKQSGRNGWQFYDPALHTRNEAGLQWIASIRAGLARHEFVNFYQPVFDMQTGELTGAEALVRWQHPTQGLVGPVHFIGAAEKSGLIMDLGRVVLFEACRHMAQWNQERALTGQPPLKVAVNLSPVQFRRANVEALVAEALTTSGLQASCLELEITESTMVDDTKQFISSLQGIQKLGASTAIDDFGTGYSNLSYLQRFAVHKLKIDQSFVREMLKGPQQRALVSAIVQIAKSMNMESHAEGIEDMETLDALKDLGCTAGQGYHYARPETAQDFEKRLLKRA